MFLPTWSSDLNPIGYVSVLKERELRGGAYGTRPLLIRAAKEG